MLSITNIVLGVLSNSDQICFAYIELVDTCTFNDQFWWCVSMTFNICYVTIYLYLYIYDQYIIDHWSFSWKPINGRCSLAFIACIQNTCVLLSFDNNERTLQSYRWANIAILCVYIQWKSFQLVAIACFDQNRTCFI